MKSTFSVIYYLKRQVVKKTDGSRHGRITVDGSQTQFSCKRPSILLTPKGDVSRQKHGGTRNEPHA